MLNTLNHKLGSISDRLEIKIVENEEERLKAFLVRGIVYIHEQVCPYVEEFDRNDFTSTQILGQIGTEPILTARIRYFGGFAKLERLAIRPQYRGKGYGHELLAFLIEFCLKKGFSDVYLHAQSRLQPFYERYGFSRVGRDFAFSDHDYVEMYASFSQLLESRKPIKLEYQPMILNRPEGQWEKPGPIERLQPISLESACEEAEVV